MSVRGRSWLTNQVFWSAIAFLGNFVAFILVRESQFFVDQLGLEEQKWQLSTLLVSAELIAPALLFCNFIWGPQIRNKCQNNLLLNVTMTYLAFWVLAIAAHLGEYPKFLIQVEDKKHNRRKIHSLFTAGAFAVSSLGLSRAMKLQFEIGVFSFCVAYAMEVSLGILKENGQGRNWFYIVGTAAFCFSLILIRKYLDSLHEKRATTADTNGHDQTGNQPPNVSIVNDSMNMGMVEAGLQRRPTQVKDGSSMNGDSDSHNGEPSHRRASAVNDEREEMEELWSVDEEQWESIPPRDDKETSSNSSDGDFGDTPLLPCPQIVNIGTLSERNQDQCCQAEKESSSAKEFEGNQPNMQIVNIGTPLERNQDQCCKAKQESSSAKEFEGNQPSMPIVNIGSISKGLSTDQGSSFVGDSDSKPPPDTPETMTLPPSFQEMDIDALSIKQVQESSCKEEDPESSSAEDFEYTPRSLVNIGVAGSSSDQNLDNSVLSMDSTGLNELEKSKSRTGSLGNGIETNVQPINGDQNLNAVFNHQDRVATTVSVPNGNYKSQMAQMQNGFDSNGVQNQQIVVNHGGYGINQMSNGVMNGENGGDSFKRDMRDLEELLSKLNPMAEEFVPPSVTNNLGSLGGGGFGFTNSCLPLTNANRRIWRKRRLNHKADMEKREKTTRRTVYVSDIDQQVTEEQLAALFLNCGQVVDCRVCGDPNSILRCAFIEFTDEDGARAALNLSGTMLGYYPVRVLPSKTAIAPVNPSFLPRSEDEREICSRTIYCTNIDKKVSQADVKLFFETLCGEVQRLKLLGGFQHSTRIAFVEFSMAESAIAALNCSGRILGTLPIRISPSKTPVRSRSPRATKH